MNNHPGFGFKRITVWFWMLDTMFVILDPRKEMCGKVRTFHIFTGFVKGGLNSAAYLETVKQLPFAGLQRFMEIPQLEFALADHLRK